MWYTIFIGFALGVLQVLLLRKTASMITSNKSNVSLGVIISIGKLALILVVLFLIAKFLGVQSVLWCAGGLAAAMISLPVIHNIRQNKKLAEQKGEQAE